MNDFYSPFDAFKGILDQLFCSATVYFMFYRHKYFFCIVLLLKHLKNTHSVKFKVARCSEQRTALNQHSNVPVIEPNILSRSFFMSC